MNPTHHIQLVTFQLAGLEPDAYRAHCEASAPAFAEIPGLRAKAWLANPSTNTYGGVYAGRRWRPTSVVRYSPRCSRTRGWPT
jgi:hypothetical protein